MITIPVTKKKRNKSRRLSDGPGLLIHFTTTTRKKMEKKKPKKLSMSMIIRAFVESWLKGDIKIKESNPAVMISGADLIQGLKRGKRN